MKDIGDLLGGQREKERILMFLVFGFKSIILEPNKYPNTYLPMPGQDQKRQYWSKDNEAVRSKDNQINKMAFPGGMMDLNSYGIQDLNTNPLLMKQQQNKALNQYGYDNNVLKGIILKENLLYTILDIMQRMQPQNFIDQNPLRSYYMQPYGNTFSEFHLII